MSKISIAVAVVGLIFFGLMIKGYTLYQAVMPNPILFWQTSNENNSNVVEHDVWGKLLAKYLSQNVEKGVREFSYQQVSQQDKKVLREYIHYLQTVDPRNYRKDEQLAYWANLYNAQTINLILTHYPVETIKDIGDGFTGPWNQKHLSVAGQSLTLNQIEHGILRALWQDKRIHYVVNCASIGCPDLPAQPLSGMNIDQQLDRAATRFINQHKGVNFDNGILQLSSIYNWFLRDFGGSEQALLEHLKQYAKPALAAQLETFSDNIEYDYNWKLNEPN